MKRKNYDRDHVTDDKGRRRFHGAFTGGFSAGYFNTVGSKEGWKPQATFRSSRSKRADPAAFAQRARDFMDDEDDPLIGQNMVLAGAAGGGAGVPGAGDPAVGAGVSRVQGRVESAIDALGRRADEFSVAAPAGLSKVGGADRRGRGPALPLVKTNDFGLGFDPYKHNPELRGGGVSGGGGGVGLGSHFGRGAGGARKNRIGLSALEDDDEIHAYGDGSGGADEYNTVAMDDEDAEEEDRRRRQEARARGRGSGRGAKSTGGGAAGPPSGYPGFTKARWQSYEGQKLYAQALASGDQAALSSASARAARARAPLEAFKAPREFPPSFSHRFRLSLEEEVSRARAAAMGGAGRDVAGTQASVASTAAAAASAATAAAAAAAKAAKARGSKSKEAASIISSRFTRASGAEADGEGKDDFAGDHWKSMDDKRKRLKKQPQNQQPVGLATADEFRKYREEVERAEGIAGGRANSTSQHSAASSRPVSSTTPALPRRTMQDWRPNKLLLKRLEVADPFVHMPGLKDGLIDAETAVIMAADVINSGGNSSAGEGGVFGGIPPAGGGGAPTLASTESQPSWTDLDREIDLLFQMFN